MKQKKKLWVPFDVSGNMLTYSDYIYPEVVANPRSDSWSFEAASWRDDTPFVANLRIVRFERGRSAAHFIWADDAGHEYTMFGKYLIDTLQSSGCALGWINATWGFVKRGANYSIVKLY